jgi:hypothetical protein
VLSLGPVRGIRGGPVFLCVIRGAFPKPTFSAAPLKKLFTYRKETFTK